MGVASPQTSEHFSDAYRRVRAATRGGGVCEPLSAAYAGVMAQEGERLLQSVWFDQYLRSDAMKTEDGRALEVLSPGWWNTEPGPDFFNAELRFDGGEAIRTDVEVHVTSADWRRHGHETDPAYERVGLHVVLENAGGDVFVTHRNGARIPQLVVMKCLSEELADIAEAARGKEPTDAHAGHGPCRDVARAKGPEWLGRFLDIAGDERILRKMERFEEQLGARTPDDVLYEGVMDALGYKSNRSPFRRLMRRLPVAELKRFVPADADPRERATVVEAILFGVAGLLPTAMSDDWDDATRRHVTALQTAWRDVERDLGGRALRPMEWTFGGMRPLNRPERRIGAAAQWLGGSLYGGLFRAMAAGIELSRGKRTAASRAAAAARAVAALFTGEGDSYWAHHCTFGGKQLPKAHQLVGRARAEAMLVNVVIPTALCQTRREGDSDLEAHLHGVYAALKPLAPNRATRYVMGRLFESPEAARGVVNSARRQQGLHQFYVDCCRAAGVTCADCLLRRVASEGVPMETAG